MKKEDLRIGNWVVSSKNPNPVKVEALTDTCIIQEWDYDGGFMEWDYHYEYLSGIPLTPEWLEKFGAILWNGGGYLIPCHDDEGQLWYHCVYKRGDRWGYNNEDDNASCSRIKYIDHVHELQNIYFALNGEELTYTP